MFSVSAGPPEQYFPPEQQGPPLPRFGSWHQVSFDRALHLRFFAEMHQAATDARRSSDRDYGWVEYDRERGWTLRPKGPLPQDRRQAQATEPASELR